MNRTMKLVATALVVLLLGGFAWWFFFLKGKTAAVPPTFATAAQGGATATFGGSSGNTSQNIIGGIATATTQGGKAPGGALPRLWHVTAAPVAGAGFVVNASTTRLRFVERATGYVSDADPSGGMLGRLTNTTVPHVYEAQIGTNGAIVERNIDGGVATAFADTVGQASSTAPAVLLQQRLPNNIETLAMNPSGTQLFYILPNAAGNAAGFTARADGSKPVQVFSSGILGWQAQFLSDGHIVLVQNASEEAQSYAYELQNGQLSPLTGAVNGLTFLPRASSANFIYGQSDTQLTLFAKNATTTLTLPIRTIADKCVWDPPRPTQKTVGKKTVTTMVQLPIVYCAVPELPPGANFLDHWYRGEAHTTDAWWKVDTSTGAVALVYTPDTNLSLDVENPVADPTGNYISFENAADKSLWLLRIAQ